MTEQRHCEWCGEPVPTNTMGKPRVFCDPKTTGRWCQKQSKRAGGVKPKTGRCSVCRKNIPDGARSDAMYCSTTCKQTARNKRDMKARKAAKKGSAS